MVHIRAFFKKELGQDNVEYALLAAFISIIAIASFQSIGPLLRSMMMGVRFALMSLQSGLPAGF